MISKALSVTIVATLLVGIVATKAVSAAPQGGASRLGLSGHIRGPKGARLVLSGHAVNNRVVVRASGVDSGTYSIDGARPVRFSAVRSVTIKGHGGVDVCQIINPRHGLFAPPGGIVCDGGNRRGAPRRGVMDVTGGVADSSQYRPGRVPGSGTQFSRLGRLTQRIRFSGLAPSTSSIAVVNFTFNISGQSSPAALVSGTTAGTWTLESLASPAAFESETFSNAANVTFQVGEGPLFLENTASEVGLTSFTVNAQGPVITAGAADAGVPVTLVGATIQAAGPAPQLTAAQLTATAPGGIGPISVSTAALTAQAASGAIDLSDSSPVNLGTVSAATALSLQITGGSQLTLTGPVSAPNITFSADAMSLSGGSVTAGDQVTLEPSTAGVPIDLGTTTHSTGQLSLAATDLNAVSSPALTVGGATAGPLSVTGSIVRGAGQQLALSGPMGIGADSGGSLSAGQLELNDLGTNGRPWTVTPSSISDGTGSPLAYSGVSTLAINAGSGSDTFDITPSSTTADAINGGGPESSPGDTLTYQAGGRVLTGSPEPGNGEVTASGVDAVSYTGIETVNVSNPGTNTATTTSTITTPTTPTSTTATPVNPPKCSIHVLSATLSTNQRGAARPAPLPLLATCDQTVKTVIAGRLTVTPKPITRAGRPKHRAHAQPRSFTLGPIRSTLTDGDISQITLRVPAAAVTALRGGARGSVKLTLTATGSAGTSTVSVSIRRLTA